MSKVEPNINGTRVLLSLNFEPPVALTKMIDTIFEQTERDVDEDLRQFEIIAEQAYALEAIEGSQYQSPPPQILLFGWHSLCRIKFQNWTNEAVKRPLARLLTGEVQPSSASKRVTLESHGI